LPFSTIENHVVRKAAKGNTGQSRPYPDNPQTLADHLLKVRTDRNLSKKAVADQIGVSPSTIGVWEKGTNKPEVIQMKSVISFLGFYPLPEPANLAGQIRKYRQVHGLTLEELGKLLGVDGATVWTWENGIYSPIRETLNQIENLLGKSGVPCLG
jgi:transcriptional regulator with XRE-family HTH domain